MTHTSAARPYLRPFAEEDASDHRIKIYKHLSRLTSDQDAGLNEYERRAARQGELAAQRHPRWRGSEGR
jgi:hypothetical protein